MITETLKKILSLHQEWRDRRRMGKRRVKFEREHHCEARALTTELEEVRLVLLAERDRPAAEQAAAAMITARKEPYNLE